uniref:Tumor necrosis factor receptor superfamily member 6 n=1 Tax=Callorhinchus milii TaxID=7868 RepID=A0A4W3ISQ8_CALMI
MGVEGARLLLQFPCVGELHGILIWVWRHLSRHELLCHRSCCCLFLLITGTYMVDPCSEPDTEGVCRPCESQTYTEYENTEVRCFVCHRCRRGDQETVSNCTPHSNTVCQCKSGYFCSPKKTCEMCSKCRTHCNSTSNTVCEARSGIAPETTGLSPGAITGNDRARQPVTGSDAVTGSDTGHRLRHCHQLRRCVCVSGSFVCYLVINEVPGNHWKQFMRRIGVLDAEIFRAEADHPRQGNEQQYEMLQTWIQKSGRQAKVNDLLQVLCNMNLVHAAEKIIEKLIEEEACKWNSQQ